MATDEQIQRILAARVKELADKLRVATQEAREAGLKVSFKVGGQSCNDCSLSRIWLDRAPLEFPI